MLAARAQALEKSDTVKELWSEALAVLATEGCEFAIYLTVNQHMQEPYVLTNVPDLYGTVDPTNDPFLSHCCESYEITKTGPAFLSDYDYLPQSAKTFIRAAAETGFKTGLGIPMRLVGSDRFGGFNIGTGMDIDTFETKIMPRAEEFRFFCLLIHRRIEELTRGVLPSAPESFRDLLVAPANAVVEGLSPREKEVIYLVARGISRKECARLCGISPHTVAEYTKSAYRKLGVANRAEAAQKLARG